MNATERSDLIDRAYYGDTDLHQQIAMLDEELTGVRPATAPEAELTERLDYWLAIAARRWNRWIAKAQLMS